MGKLIGEDDFLARYVTWALWLLAIIVCIATVTGQVESFNGLYIWFATHGITGFWADFAPLMVDSFTVVGELAIFAGISRHWDWPSRILPWASAMIGIGASVAANVGDKIGHPLSWELTAAIPPLAGAFGIVIGLGVLKRVAKDWSENRAKKQVSGLTEEQKALQIAADQEHLNDTLARWKAEGKMDPPPKPEPGVDAIGNEYAPADSASSGQELKGLDVLIPPRPPETEWATGTGVYTIPTADVTTAEHAEGSIEDRRRLSERLAGRQVISPAGLDPTATGSFPAVPADA